MFYKCNVKWSYEDEVIYASVLGKADGFIEAMTQITKEFGDQELWEVHFEWISDDEVLDIKDLYNAYKIEEEQESSELGPQLIEALNEAVMVTKDMNEEV